MKKLSENARCEPTYMQRDDRMRKLDCFYKEDKTGASDANPNHSFNTQHEYKLSLTVGTTFWCNSAQHERARQEAERLLVRELFNDALRWIQRCRTAIVEHEPEMALHALGELEKEITE